jgi:hypothetical protein
MVQAGLNVKYLGAIGGGRHGLNRVHDQIQKYLLQLHKIGPN